MKENKNKQSENKMNNEKETEQKKSFWQKITSFFGKVFGAIGGFFVSLFNREPTIYVREEQPRREPQNPPVPSKEPTKGKEHEKEKEPHKAPTPPTKPIENTQEPQHSDKSPNNSTENMPAPQPSVPQPIIEEKGAEKVPDKKQNDGLTIPETPSQLPKEKSEVLPENKLGNFAVDVENNKSTEAVETEVDDTEMEQVDEDEFAPPPPESMEIPFVFNDDGIGLPVEEIAGVSTTIVADTTVEDKESAGQPAPHTFEQLCNQIKECDSRAIAFNIADNKLYVAFEIEDGTTAIATFTKFGYFGAVGRCQMVEGEQITNDNVISKSEKTAACSLEDVCLTQTAKDIKDLLSRKENDIEKITVPEKGVQKKGNEEMKTFEPVLCKNMGELIKQVEHTLGIAGQQKVSYEPDDVCVKIEVEPQTTKTHMESERYLMINARGEYNFTIGGVSFKTMNYEMCAIEAGPDALSEAQKNVVEIIKANAKLFPTKAHTNPSKEMSIADEVLDSYDNYSDYTNHNQRENDRAKTRSLAGARSRAQSDAVGHLKPKKATSTRPPYKPSRDDYDK